MSNDSGLSRTLDSLIGIVSQMEQGLSAVQKKIPLNNRDLGNLRSAMLDLTHKVQTIQVKKIYFKPLLNSDGSFGFFFKGKKWLWKI